MKTDKKKLAAAIAAVYAHLSTNEQVVYAPSVEAGAGLAPAPNQVAALLSQAATLLAQATALLGAQAPAAPNNAWGASGRQTQMQANTMMQTRAFK